MKKITDYLETGRKICTCCILEKEVSEFHQNGGGKYGLRSRCKECMYLSKIRGKDFNKEEREAYKQRKKEKTKERRRRAPYRSYERQRDIMLQCKYGITYDDFEQMKLKQDGKCFICCNITDKLCVDHCHTSGKVRKLLCDNCNKTLGLVKENKQVLQNMIDYLEKEK